MRNSQLRNDIHRTLDQLARPVPGLLSRSMTAVRTKPAETGNRAPLFRNLAGAAALVLTAILVGVLVLRTVSLHAPVIPSTENGVWPEDLTLAGEVNAHAMTTVPNSGAIRSSCTGKHGRTVGSYELTLAIDTDRGVWQLFLTVDSYSGPGTYSADATPATKARSPRGGIVNPARSQAWEAGPADSFTITVDPSEEAGTISATFSQSDPPAPTSSTQETVSGTWSCRTSQ